MQTTVAEPRPERGSDGRRSRFGRAIGLAALAGLAGLGVGRFVGYDGGGGQAPVTAVASSPEARLVALEQDAVLRPDDPLVWQELGSTYVRLAIATGNPDHFTGAERALARASELDPDSPVTLVAQGTFALTLHQFADALALGERAEVADPFNPEAKAVRVDALVELGRYDEAARVLEDLLALRPGLAALTRVSYLRQLEGDLDGALAAMQQAQGASGGRGFEAAVATALEGEIQLLRGDLDAAADAFEASLRLSPGLVAGELGRARALDAVGERDEAIDRLRVAVDELGAPGLALLLGELLEASGREREAEDAYEIARQVYRDEVAAGAIVDLEVAYLEADHGPPAVALEAARRAYAARPNIYTADAMAWTLHRSGRDVDALPHAREALAHGTADPALRVHAATVLVANGLVEEARRVLAPTVALGGYLPPPLRRVATATAADVSLDVPSHWQDPTA